MFGGVSIPWKKSKTLLKGEKAKQIDTAVHSLDCTHDWQFVQDRQSTVEELSGTVQMNALAYCPICKTSQIFSADDWAAILKIQEIEKKYKR
jgi:hypothetical protein